MKKKNSKVLIILLIQVLVIIGTAFFFTTQNKRLVKPQVAYQFARDIKRIDKPIKESDIKAVQLPASAITKNMALNKDEIVGKYLDAKVWKDNIVYKDHLINKEEVDVFETMDLSKYRKISLPINMVEGLAGNIKKGDTIDLAFTSGGSKDADKETGEKGGAYNYSKVFLQDVLVYNVNTADGHHYKDKSDITQEEIYSMYDDEISIEEYDSDDLAIITLAVTLDEAEQIYARRTKGQISVIGRFDESVNYNTMGYVMGNYDKEFTGEGLPETGIIDVNEDNFMTVKEAKEIEEDSFEKVDK